MRLKDKVAIVTGGSQGIGEAISRAFGREGARVVVGNYGNLDLGEKVVEDIVQAGGTATAIPCDVTKKSEVQALVRQVIDEFGTVDILASNAGIMINRRIEDYTEEEWDRTIDTNLKGCFLTAQAVVPIMKAKKYGKIIFTASTLGSVAMPDAVAYCASKGGVLQIMKALAAEIAKHGINVNAISPGSTATPLNQHLQNDPEFVKMLEQMTPTGRAYLSTEDLAGAAVFLASDEARAVNGLDLLVDDGLCAM